jgi:solute:Na+ symporter, SSS family
LHMIDNGLRIYATAIVIITALGFASHPNQKAIFITILAVISAICIIYTVLGGQAAVIVSEFVQAIVMLAAIYLVTHLCLAPFDSFADFWRRLPAGHKEWTRPPYDWTFLIFSTLLISFMNYSAGWALVQKFNTVRSEQDARKMVWLVTFLKMITPPLFFLPGLAAVVLMPGLKNPRYAFSEISFSLLPIGLVGFLLAAMFSATTSTLGAEYNTLSGIITRDFYRRVLRPEATEKQQVFIGRMATIVIGVLTMLIAVLIEYIPALNLMDIMKRTFAAFGPPIFIPLFIGLINRRFNAFGVWLGVILGATVGFFGGTINIWLISVFREEMSNPTVDYWLRGAFTSIITVTNCLTVLFGMWLGSKLRPMSSETRQRIDDFFKDLETPFVIDRSLKGVESPFRLIGATTALFGGVMILVSFLILFVYHKEHPVAFKFNFWTALVLVALGLGMRYFSSSGRRLSPSDAGETSRAIAKTGS